MERGIVSVRVGFALRSAEIQPSFRRFVVDPQTNKTWLCRSRLAASVTAHAPPNTPRVLNALLLPKQSRRIKAYTQLENHPPLKVSTSRQSGLPPREGACSFGPPNHFRAASRTLLGCLGQFDILPSQDFRGASRFPQHEVRMQVLIAPSHRCHLGRALFLLPILGQPHSQGALGDLYPGKTSGRLT